MDFHCRSFLVWVGRSSAHQLEDMVIDVRWAHRDYQIAEKENDARSGVVSRDEPSAGQTVEAEDVEE